MTDRASLIRFDDADDFRRNVVANQTEAFQTAFAAHAPDLGVNGTAKVMTAALRGHPGPALDHLRTIYDQAATAGVATSRLGVAALRRVRGGLHAGAAIGLAAYHMHVIVKARRGQGADASIDAARIPGRFSMGVRLGADIWLEAGPSIRLPRQLETVLAQMNGRPVGSMIRHPLLDDERLIIRDVGEWDDAEIKGDLLHLEAANDEVLLRDLDFEGLGPLTDWSHAA